MKRHLPAGNSKKAPVNRPELYRFIGGEIHPTGSLLSRKYIFIRPLPFTLTAGRD